MATVAAVKQFTAVQPEEIEGVAFRMAPMEDFEEFLKRKGALGLGS